MKKRLLGVVYVISISLLSGCTVSPDTMQALGESDIPFGLPEIDVSSYSDVRAELIPEESRFVFPIDRYMMMIEDLDRIDRTAALQMKKCMSDSGYSYWDNEIPPSAYSGTFDRRYGIWNLADAAQYGYGLPRDLFELLEEMAEAEASAYTGSSEGADDARWECADSIDRLPWIGRGSGLVEDYDRALFLPVEIDYQASFLAREDERYDEAFAAWAACLEENGLRRGEGPEELGPADVPEELEAQIRVAVIDVTCKQETGFIEKLSSLEAQYQAALIDQNRAALEASVQKQAELLRRADEIIATHG